MLSEMGISKTGFAVKEFAERDPAFRFEHTLDINDFLKMVYYDDGKAAFHSAILTINLDGVGKSTETVWLAIKTAVRTGQPNVTSDQVVELINVICPIFDDVLTGKERVNGAQGGTLHGVGYLLELSDTERFARLFINAELTKN
jgi:hypothetical protein